MCGEATGSHPKGGGVCTQQMGAGGGETNEPSEWKTPALRMALSSGCHGGVSAVLMGWIPGADVDSVEIRISQGRASVKANTRHLLFASTLWPIEHLCYHYSTGKDAHKITGPGKELG